MFTIESILGNLQWTEIYHKQYFSISNKNKFRFVYDRLDQEFYIWHLTQ